MKAVLARAGSLLIVGCGLALFVAGCVPASAKKMEPTLVCPLPVSRISCASSAFPQLTTQERGTDWARELLVGDAFAKEGDFYRAITAYKRARIFLTNLKEKSDSRQLQIDYDITLCYYLAGKCQEALNTFEASPLSQANADFPAFNNLLLIVYDCYLQTDQEEKAECLLQIIDKCSPEAAEDLSLYQCLKQGEGQCAACAIAKHRFSDSMQADFDCYRRYAKSPAKARWLNALLPGAGYAYVGLKKSAVTSFLINALFTAAAYQFFHRGDIAAGVITASLEAGWYFGGINGAGIEAEVFNTRLYEGVSRKILSDHACFPVLMFETAF